MTASLKKLLLTSALLLVFVASTTGTVIGQGGWVRTQRGQAGEDLNAVYFADSKRGWIGGNSGLFLRTKDGGRSWARQKIDAADNINDVYFRDREDGYLLTGNRIYISDDSGETWREIRRFLPVDFGGDVPELYSVRFADKKKGWVVGSVSRRSTVVDSLILHTKDGGLTWQRQRTPTRSELIHVDFVDDQLGWIVGATGTILNTRDGGRTWTQQRSGTTTTIYHVDFRNEDNGLAVGERGMILRTTDGGTTWSAVSSPLRSTLLSVKLVDGSDSWIVGRGGVILRSGDGGRTWIRQESQTGQNLYALFIDKKNGWAVGGDGIVLQYKR